MPQRIADQDLSLDSELVTDVDSATSEIYKLDAMYEVQYAGTSSQSIAARRCFVVR
jgi:hypothetical protein